MTQPFTWLLTAACVLCSVASAQEIDHGKYHAGWKTYFQKVAKGYSITTEEGGVPFKVTEKPVQSFYASGGGEYNQGTFFVWSHQGRAKAIGELWSYGSLSGGAGTVVHEMHSLSDDSFRARKSAKDAKDFWSPKLPGVKWQPLPETYAAPKKTRGLRMAQMRAIARDFRGIAHRTNKEQELRVPQHPIFRYEENEERQTVIDGAVFAFCAEWDPEILLVIEAHRENDEMKWYFSGARLCDVPLSLHIGEAQVWQVDRALFRNGALNKPTDPYYAVHGVASMDPENLPTADGVDNKPVRP